MTGEPNINDDLLWTMLNNCRHSAEIMSNMVGLLRRNGSAAPEIQHALKQAEESINLAAGYIEHAQGDIQIGGGGE